MGLSLSGTFPNKLKETLAQSKKAYGCLDSVSLTPVLCRIDGFSSNFLEHHPLLPSSEEKDRWLLSALLTGNEELVDQKIDNWLNYRLGTSHPQLENVLQDWLNYRLGTSHPQLENVLQVIEEEKQLFTNWAHMFEKRHQGFYHQSSYRLCCYADVCDSGFSFSFSKFKHRIHMDIFFLYQELKDFHSPESDMIYQVAHYLELNYNQPFSQFACAQMFYVNKEYLCRKFKNTFHISMVTYLNDLRINHAKRLLEDSSIFACAQMFYVNKEYLCRKFKNTFHISMVTYLNDLRINHAKRLLEDSSIKIRQIAHEVGYEDEKYFSRQFKKVTGMTPNEYRLNSLLT